MRRTLLAGIGGVLAALLGSLCCAGPLVFLALGVGAGLATTFEPFRPIFGLLMVAALGTGFYTVYGRGSVPAEASPEARTLGDSCPVTRRRTRDRVLLWSATALAIALWTFPTWSRLLI